MSYHIGFSAEVVTLHASTRAVTAHDKRVDLRATLIRARATTMPEIEFQCVPPTPCCVMSDRRKSCAKRQSMTEALQMTPKLASLGFSPTQGAGGAGEMRRFICDRTSWRISSSTVEGHSSEIFWIFGGSQGSCIVTGHRWKRSWMYGVLQGE